MNMISQDARVELYSELLGTNEEFLEGLKSDAEKAGQGIKADIRLWQKDHEGNVEPYDLYIPKYGITSVVARTGGGKTAMLTNLAVRLSMNGGTGMYVTLEEPAFAITAKMLASYSGYKNQNHSMQALSTSEAIKVIAGKTISKEMPGFEREVLNKCRPIDANKLISRKDIASSNLLYQPQYIQDLMDYVNSDERGEKISFIIVDFGQLLEVAGIDNSNTFNKIKKVMQALKNMAGTGIAVIIGMQMKREVSAKWIWDFECEDVKEGGDAEQATSLMVCIGRDNKQPDIDQFDVIRILKNRYGPKRVGGACTINFKGNYIPTLTEQPTEKAL